MASPEVPDCGDGGKLPFFRHNLPANLQTRQTMGHVSKKDLNVSAELAFTKREEDYSDRVSSFIL